jgi:predicted amino acid racemase
MFLQVILERNPDLAETAIRLHQDGTIPPNSFVFDLDTVHANGRVLAEGARRHGFRTFAMTKQHARNPFVTMAAIRGGIDSTVAVDVQCAKQMHRYRVPVGHVGHLNQIPMHDVKTILAMAPEVFTVYTLDEARRVSDAAGELGLTQRLLMRPFGPNDIFFTGQEGGFPIDEFRAAAGEIASLPHVVLAGVTAFPCISYNATRNDPVEATPNFHTARAAAEILCEEGITASPEINAPGNTSSDTYPLLASMGATQVEPGNGILGTTPNHSFKAGLPELPAYVYVTEVSHHFDGRGYAFGGGLFTDIFDPAFQAKALVGRDFESARANPVDFLRKPMIIDYHAELSPGDRCRVGDSVLLGFRSQIQMTRAYVAVVRGIHRGSPELVAIFDAQATMLDSEYNPVPPASVVDLLQGVVGEYPAFGDAAVPA